MMTDPSTEDVLWGIANAVDDRIVTPSPGRRMRAEWMTHDVMRLRALDGGTIGDYRVTVTRADPGADAESTPPLGSDHAVSPEPPKTFVEALRSMLAGRLFTRLAWGGSDTYVVMGQIAIDGTTAMALVLAKHDPDGNETWVPSVMDMLASDWVEVFR